MNDVRVILNKHWRPTLGQLADLRLDGDGFVYSGEHVVGRWELVPA